MINTLWMLLIGLGIGAAAASGKIDQVSPVIFNSARQAIEFAFGLTGMIAFWSGMLKIAEVSGITAGIAKLFRPLLTFLFPDLKRDQSALGMISLTMAANLLGLGNVATPLGLKTIEKIQSHNLNPERASDSICTFMILIFGGLCVIPSTLIAVRSQTGSVNPALILIPLTLITISGTILSLTLNYLAIKITPLRWKGKRKRRLKINEPRTRDV
ncbi:MAG: nucleoside recognition protein [Firmicutes bacterium]|nr:nucleoside recognition protein [Bacillota bacterium]